MFQIFAQSLMILDSAVAVALFTLALSFVTSLFGLTRAALEAMRGSK